MTENCARPRRIKPLGSRNKRSFFFRHEAPSFGAFFRTAIFRLALTYPFCVVCSNSLTDIWDLLLIVFWFLSGHWKERFRIVKNSPILILSVILMLISFVGVFQYETSFFQSLKYWRGHHPIPVLIVLGTIFTTKSRRFQMLGAVGLALLIGLTYSIAVKYGSTFQNFPRFLEPAHIAKNTIWFGMAFVVLTGLWVCFPFSSRLNPAIRPWLGVTLKSAMRNASSLSIPRQILSFFYSPGYSFATHLLCFIRWGIVLLSVSYVMLFNPSRTAVVAILLGISTMLLLWNWRLGIIVTLLFVILTFYVSYIFSPTFQQKLRFTVDEVEWFQHSIAEDTPDNAKVIGGRLFLYWNMAREITRHPLGIGMEETRQKCLEYTKNRLDNVHNEFIAIGVQSGIQGLTCFLLWFFFLFRQSFFLPAPWKTLGLYAGVTLFIACIFNGALSQDMEGHLYCILIALVASVDAERHQKTARRFSPLPSRGNFQEFDERG